MTIKAIDSLDRVQEVYCLLINKTVETVEQVEVVVVVLERFFLG